MTAAPIPAPRVGRCAWCNDLYLVGESIIAVQIEGQADWVAENCVDDMLAAGANWFSVDSSKLVNPDSSKCPFTVDREGRVRCTRDRGHAGQHNIDDPYRRPEAKP